MATTEWGPWEKALCHICGFTYLGRKLIYQAGRYVCRPDFDSEDRPRKGPHAMPGYGEGKYGIDPYGS